MHFYLPAVDEHPGIGVRGGADFAGAEKDIAGFVVQFIYQSNNPGLFAHTRSRA